MIHTNTQKRQSLVSKNLRRKITRIIKGKRKTYILEMRVEYKCEEQRLWCFSEILLLFIFPNCKQNGICHYIVCTLQGMVRVARELLSFSLPLSLHCVISFHIPPFVFALYVSSITTNQNSPTWMLLNFISTLLDIPIRDFLLLFIWFAFPIQRGWTWTLDLELGVGGAFFQNSYIYTHYIYYMSMSLYIFKPHISAFKNMGTSHFHFVLQTVSRNQNSCSCVPQ